MFLQRVEVYSITGPPIFKRFESVGNRIS